MIYFTSDIHHRHKRICEITDRHKVVDQTQHDEWLIELWNRQVTKQDTVYHLGDFSFASKYEDVEEYVEDEKFWCLTTNNQNFVMRRNGRVHLTGNSHGNHSGSGKLLDVGLDSAYNILGEHRLFTQDEIYEILSNKQVTINDSHRKEKTP